MKRFLHKLGKHKSGFTLVELIVTIAMLAILAGMMIPAMRSWILKAQQASVLSDCRACVIAANAVVVEQYAINGRVDEVSNYTVQQFSGIDKGLVTGIRVDKGTYIRKASLALQRLTYLSEDGIICTYIGPENGKDAYYVFGNGDEWDIDGEYKPNDLIYSNGYIFKCIKEHDAGTTQYTRDPGVGFGNKTAWRAIGFNGAPQQYTSTIRYDQGFIITYNGRKYERTNYDLGGGQPPHTDKSSDYWRLLT